MVQTIPIFPVGKSIGNNREFLKTQLLNNQLIDKNKCPIPFLPGNREMYLFDDHLPLRVLLFGKRRVLLLLLKSVERER